jgi:hypothetical protein
VGATVIGVFFPEVGHCPGADLDAVTGAENGPSHRLSIDPARQVVGVLDEDVLVELVATMSA